MVIFSCFAPDGPGPPRKLIMKNMRRAERRRRTEVIKNRRINEFFRNRTWSNLEFYSKRDLDILFGQCRVKSPFDCGHPGCIMCHHEKVYGIKRRLAGESDLDYTEQVNELYQQD